MCTYKREFSIFKVNVDVQKEVLKSRQKEGGNKSAYLIDDNFFHDLKFLHVVEA